MYTTTYYQTTTAAPVMSTADLMPVFVCLLAITVIAIVTTWKIFEKAGEKGWKSLIPFYNYYITFKIAGWNPWMFLLLYVPFVGIVIGIILPFKLADAFKRSWVFGLGLLFFAPIFACILAFGNSKYNKSAKYKG